MRRGLLLSAIISLALGCSSSDEQPTGYNLAGGGTSGGSAGAGGGSGGGGPTQVKQLPLATGMSIGEVSLYQGVKIKLFDGVTEVTDRAAPVVAGRPGRLRVFFAPQADWQPRPVTVRLTLKNGTGDLPTMELTGQPAGASSEADMTSAAYFDIPGEQLTGDLSFSVSILEADAAATGPGTTDGARVPAEGVSAFHEESPGGPLRIVVIPVTYNADQSGRVPDTSDQRIEQYRQQMLKMYPAADVQMIVGQPLAWSSTVSPNGNGWQNLLDKMVSRRGGDGVDDDVYYYGLFNPADSEFQFCSGGCAAGLTYISGNSHDVSLRTSIGLGYAGNDTMTTMAHEVGHAHGRLHAPCQIPDPSSVDQSYPDKSGRLSGWGYDIVTQQLFAPKVTADVMGYCTPVWVSEYTYTALFNRMKFVHSAAYVLPPKSGKASRWTAASLDMSGELRWGQTLTSVGEPDGEPRDVTLLDESGQSVGQAHGYFLGLSHVPGGRLLLPEGTPRSHAIKTLDGVTYARH